MVIRVLGKTVPHIPDPIKWTGDEPPMKSQTIKWAALREDLNLLRAELGDYWKLIQVNQPTAATHRVAAEKLGLSKDDIEVVNRLLDPLHGTRTSTNPLRIQSALIRGGAKTGWQKKRFEETGIAEPVMGWETWIRLKPKGEFSPGQISRRKAREAEDAKWAKARGDHLPKSSMPVFETPEEREAWILERDERERVANLPLSQQAIYKERQRVKESNARINAKWDKIEADEAQAAIDKARALEEAIRIQRERTEKVWPIAELAKKRKRERDKLALRAKIKRLREEAGLPYEPNGPNVESTQQKEES